MVELQKLQQVLDLLFPGLMGVRLRELAPERVLAELTVRPELCTTGGVLHGGAIMAFADTLGGSATSLNLPPGAGTTTIESKTNFFRGVRGGTVHAVAEPLHVGRGTIVVQTASEW